MTRPTTPATEAGYQDGPTTNKPHGTPFSRWVILHADDADGVRWYFHVPEAAPRAEGLDARRFGTAIRNAGVNWTLGDVGKVLTEYARLSRPSDERVPESEEPR